jgi:hypothetical protein
MSISKEVWISLLENAPSACTVALGEVAAKQDLASIDNAVDAGVAGAGSDFVKQDRIRKIADGLSAPGTDDCPATTESISRNVKAFTRYLAGVESVVALDAALSDMVMKQKREMVDALVRSGASPYRSIVLGDLDSAGEPKLTRHAVHRFLDLGEVSALLMHKHVFGAEKITGPEQLPRQVILKIDHRSQIECNLLEACILMKHAPVAARIRDLIRPGPGADEIYFQMGDQVLRLLGLPVNPEERAGNAPAKKMHANNEGIGLALRLISSGAQMRDPAQWEKVLWREVGDHASPLFAAVQRSQQASEMHIYGLSRDDMDEIFKASIKVGLDVNGLNKMGGSFLIDAAAHGNTQLVETLLLAGADTKVTIPGPDGQYSALDFALERDNETIIKMLRSAQARQAVMSVANAARSEPA